jgi:hypothetical protein
VERRRERKCVYNLERLSTSRALHFRHVTLPSLDGLTPTVSCGTDGRGRCAGNARDRTDRQLHGHVRWQAEALHDHLPEMALPTISN